MEYKEGKIYIGINQKNTKCYVYLEIYDPSGKVLTMLGQTSKGTVTDFSKTACATNTNNPSHDTGSCNTTESGVYEAQDDYGTSYYYRGTVDNNWVKFAGFWWRIIRINGNGSIRMIYSGTVENGTQPTDTSANGSNNGRWVPKDNSQLASTSAYNKSYKDNTYVGFYNKGSASTSYADAHAATNNNPSTIAGVLNAWYTSSELSSQSVKLDGATGWCNDRTPYQYSGISASSHPNTTSYGFGTTATRYGAYFRRDYSHQPTYSCSSNDLFTLNGSTTGNKKLTIPVGLITADEVKFAGAGGGGANNYGYWLYTGWDYWTMSPFSFYNDYAYVFAVRTNGSLSDTDLFITYGVRPVINLKEGTTFNYGGNGTISNPYIVS